MHRASLLTAGILGLVDRGAISVGGFADVTVFDPTIYGEAATYEQPDRLARGVHHVLVNGRLVVDGGQPTGALPGRPLAKPRQTEWNCPA